MKGVSVPKYDTYFMVEPSREGFGWDVRFYNQIMGSMPIGLRLSKGSLPNFARNADTKEDAELLCKEWNNWLKTDSQAIRLSLIHI